MPGHPVLSQYLCRLSHLALCLAPLIVLFELQAALAADDFPGCLNYKENLTLLCRQRQLPSGWIT